MALTTQEIGEENQKGEEPTCFLPSISLWENMLQYEFCLFGVKSIVLYYNSIIWDLRAYSEGVDCRYWVSIHHLNMLWFFEQLVSQIGYLLQKSVLKDVFTVNCLLFTHLFLVLHVADITIGFPGISCSHRFIGWGWWVCINEMNLYWCEQVVNYLMCEYRLGM